MRSALDAEYRLRATLADHLPRGFDSFVYLLAAALAADPEHSPAVDVGWLREQDEAALVRYADHLEMQSTRCVGVTRNGSRCELLVSPHASGTDRCHLHRNRDETYHARIMRVVPRRKIAELADDQSRNVQEATHAGE